MDDGNSWIGILLLGAAFVIYYLIYGFGAAIQALNTSALEDEREEGNKKAERLLHIQENPHGFVQTNQLITMVFSLAMGGSSLQFDPDEFLRTHAQTVSLITSPIQSACSPASTE